MRLFIGIILTSFFLIISCNSENELILEENLNKLLKQQLNKKLEDSKSLYMTNKMRYHELYELSNSLTDSYNLIDKDFSNNISEFNSIFSYYKQINADFNSQELNTLIEKAKDENDKALKLYLKNKFLILANDIMYDEIRQKLAKGYHFTNVKSVVQLENEVINQGDFVKAKVFLMAFDTTQRPVYLIDDKKHGVLVIDSFDNDLKGVYYLKTNKKGKYTVKGKTVFMVNDLFIQEIDSSNFSFEYIVK